MRSSLRKLLFLFFCAVVLSGCNTSGGSSSPAPSASSQAPDATPASPAQTPSSSDGLPTAEPSASPSASAADEPASPPELTEDSVRLEAVVPKGSYDRPVGLEKRPGVADVLYVVEQPGRIRTLDLNDPQAKPALVLDITDRVRDDGMEKGLLGLAFHPTRPGEAYVNYTTSSHTVIARFTSDPADANRLDPASEQVILTFRQPRSNHNGGQLAFGPDGMLYIASGDGGGSGDPSGHGQNTNSLLGKILRIDVDRTEGDLAYAIPADNPFANGGGAPEIYAYGLRNPWRFSFDPETGKLWAADVGQNKLEEINIIEKGGNYGWNIREGTACYKPAQGCASEGLIPPIYEYGRDLGVSITGGYVYRGKQIAALTGWYVYADYGSGTIWALQEQSGGTVRNLTMIESGMQITSFGVDDKGEIYVVVHNGEIYRLVPA